MPPGPGFGPGGPGFFGPGPCFDFFATMFCFSFWFGPPWMRRRWVPVVLFLLTFIIIFAIFATVYDEESCDGAGHCDRSSVYAYFGLALFLALFCLMGCCSRVAEPPEGSPSEYEPIKHNKNDRNEYYA